MLKKMDGSDSTSFSSGTLGVTKSTAASKCSHKEAERRRRQRINAHLSTLRTLLPSKTKTDKATLLAEVVKHTKELQKTFADVAGRFNSHNDYCSTLSSNRGSDPLLPSEFDEVKLTYTDRDLGTVKAVLCCEDRPGLNRDVIMAIGSVRARAVKAEMVTVGGRTKNVLVMQCGGEDEVGMLKRALKGVVENRVGKSGSVRELKEIKMDRFYGSVNLI